MKQDFSHRRASVDGLYNDFVLTLDVEECAINLPLCRTMLTKYIALTCRIVFGHYTPERRTMQELWRLTCALHSGEVFDERRLLTFGIRLGEHSFEGGCRHGDRNGSIAHRPRVVIEEPILSRQEK